MSGINTILDIRDFFFLILPSWSYFLFRITEIAIISPYIQALSLSLHYVFSEDWPHLSHLCVVRKAPDKEWALTQYMWFKGRDEY